MKYPQNLSNMMDIMRQQPIWKRKTSPIKSPEKEKEKDKEGKGATSFAQSESKDYACYCCGSKTSRYNRCPKKKDLPPEKWFNPEFRKNRAEEMKKKDSNATTTTTAVVTAQHLVNKVSFKEGKKRAFSGAQTIIVEKDRDPEVIWDFGSSITLEKNKYLLEDIKECKVTMCTNGGNRQITQEGTWMRIGQAYLDGQAITNIVSQSEAIKRWYHVTFDSDVKNAFIIKDQQNRVARYPVDERGLYVREILPPVDCYVSYVLATSIEGYTPREVERAARARKLYHNLSAENIRNVKVWI